MSRPFIISGTMTVPDLGALLGFNIKRVRGSSDLKFGPIDWDNDECEIRALNHSISADIVGWRRIPICGFHGIAIVPKEPGIAAAMLGMPVLQDNDVVFGICIADAESVWVLPHYLCELYVNNDPRGEQFAAPMLDASHPSFKSAKPCDYFGNAVDIQALDVKAFKTKGKTPRHVLPTDTRCISLNGIIIKNSGDVLQAPPQLRGCKLLTGIGAIQMPSMDEVKEALQGSTSIKLEFDETISFLLELKEVHAWGYQCNEPRRAPRFIMEIPVAKRHVTFAVDNRLD